MSVDGKDRNAGSLLDSDTSSPAAGAPNASLTVPRTVAGPYVAVGWNTIDETPGRGSDDPAGGVGVVGPLNGESR